MTSTYPGMWWIAEGTPAASEAARHGVLTRFPDGRLQLDLIDGFTTLVPSGLPDGRPALSNGEGYFPVIHGESNKQKITLLEGNATVNIPYFGPQPQRVNPQRGIFGVHLLPDEDSIASARFEIENLSEFLDPLQRQLSKETAESGFAIPRLASQSVEVGDWSVEIGMQRKSRRRSGRDAGTLVIDSVGFVRVSRKEVASLQTFVEIDKALQDFVTFVADQGSATLTWQGTDTAGDTFEFVERVVLEPDLDAPAQNDYKFLFTSQDIEVGEVVRRWLELWYLTRPTLDIMLSMRYSDVFLEFEALALATSVESLHPKLDKGAVMRPQEEFKAGKAAIEQLIERELPEFLPWVQGKLTNDLTFRRRAELLAGRVSEPVLSRWIDDAPAWAAALQKSRRAAAHGSQGNERDKLRVVIYQTRYLLALVLMVELGVPPEVQLRMISMRGWVQELARKIQATPAPE